MWMTTLIMPPGCLMVQGAIARREVVPVQQEVVSHHAASEVAFLQSLGQASALPVDAAPVDLARYDIAVSQGWRSWSQAAQAARSCDRW